MQRKDSANAGLQGAPAVSVRMPSWMAEMAVDGQHQRMMFRAKVAGRLVAAIARAGMTPARLARKIGVSRAQISQQLSGDANLTLDSLHRLSTAAGLTLDVQFRSVEHLAAARSVLAGVPHLTRSTQAQLDLGATAARPTINRVQLVELLRTQVNCGAIEFTMHDETTLSPSIPPHLQTAANGLTPDTERAA